MCSASRYKPSAFNVFKRVGDCILVSNTLTRSLAEIDERHYDVLTGHATVSSLDEDEISPLVEEGLLVPERLDEVALLRLSSARGRFSNELAELAIAPTMACNFACPYCFESHRTIRMDNAVRDAVVRHVESLLEQGVQSLQVSWYGGEPLLCPEIVEELSVRISQACSAKGVPVAYSMTTNGYLLSEDNLSMLQRCGINEIQVTLDGDQEAHDCHRFLVGGGPTFETIISNLKRLASYGIRLHVRVNVDKGNPGAFSRVCELLAREGIETRSVYPALIEQTPNQEEAQRSLCYGRSEIEDYYQGDVRAYYLRDGFLGMRFVACNCGAEHAYSTVVDPEGYLYKCWNDVGRPERAYASLMDESYENPVDLVAYLGRDPFSEPECSGCAYLPICLGGCLWEYLDKGTHACVSERELYWDILQENYLSNDMGEGR